VTYPGGIPNPRWLIWILRSAESSQLAARKPAEAQALTAVHKNPMAWFRESPAARGELFRNFPEDLKVYQPYSSHPAFDDYWRQRGYYTAGFYQEMKDVPILFVSGWYDYFVDGELDNFVALSKLQKSAKKVIIGPWPHGIGTTECGNAAFGPDTD